MLLDDWLIVGIVALVELLALPIVHPKPWPGYAPKPQGRP